MKHLQTLIIIGIFSLLLPAAVSAGAEPSSETAGEPEKGPLATVRAFMAAFNEHDIEAMRELLSPEAAWHSINGAELVTEASDRAELMGGMRQYFGSVPDVHSSIEAPLVDGPRVVFRERVSWDGGNRSQTAVAVYEVRDGRVAAAWYFPASP